MIFSCCCSAKWRRECPLLLAVPSPNALVQDFGVEVAHNDVKMGFAISDEDIHVLINYVYLFISMASCWKISLDYIQMIFVIDLKGELGQHIGRAFDAGDISCNFLVYHETDSPMAGVGHCYLECCSLLPSFELH